MPRHQMKCTAFSDLITWAWGCLKKGPLMGRLMGPKIFAEWAHLVEAERASRGWNTIQYFFEPVCCTLV